jgi:CRISPR-associated endonuclease/helicase Cas3
LDSAVQAAGRCNREGELSPDEAIVSLFRPDEAYRNKRPRSLGQPIEVMRMIEKQYNDDIASPEAIHAYFSQLFAFKGERLDKQGIVKRLDDCMKTRNLSIPFAEVAKLFRVIDSPTRAVLIPEDEAAAEIIAQLESGVRSARLMRKAGMHTVAVYPKQFDALLGAGAIRMLDEELAVLRDESLYTKDTGLHIPDGGIGIIA